MANYYVTHPNLSITALIDAPSTEKARTTFLDYLERRNLVARADRQYWRKNMVAERMTSPEDVQADIELHYGYQEGGQQMPPSMTQVPARTASIEHTESLPTYERDEEVPLEQLDADWLAGAERVESPEEDIPVTPTSKSLSPIAQVSLGRMKR